MFNYVINGNTLTAQFNETAIADFVLGTDGNISATVHHEIAQSLTFEKQAGFYQCVSQGYTEAENKLKTDLAIEAFHDVFNANVREVYSKYYNLESKDGLLAALLEYNKECGNGSFLKIFNASYVFSHLTNSEQESIISSFEWVYCLDDDYYQACAYVSIYGEDDFITIQNDYHIFELGFMNCDDRLKDRKVKDNLHTTHHVAKRSEKTLSAVERFESIEDIVNHIFK